MSEEYFTKEKRILIAMRKTLGAVIKDVTPSNSAFKSPLSESTIEDVKMCFGLIAAREREIAEEADVEIKDRPQFTDEIKKDNVVSIASLKATLPDNTSKSNNGSDNGKPNGK